MALSRRIITKEIRVPTAAAGAQVVWRAPVDCTITHVHGRRDGGTSASVNAQIGAVDVLAADLAAGNAAYATGTPTGDAGVMAAGTVLSLEVTAAVGTPTVLVQADIAVDVDVRDLP